MEFPGGLTEGNDMGSAEIQGRPDPEDDRGGTQTPASSSADEPVNRRRRVVLHQGLPDLAEPEDGAR